MADSNNNLPDEQKRLIRAFLTLTGIVLFMLGMALVAFPIYGETLFDLEPDISRIMGAVLVFVGISDVFIAKFLFGESTK